MSFRTIVTFVSLMACLTVRGQHLDSVQLDLKHLKNLEFFKKYSFYDNTTTNKDMKVTKIIWSLHHLRSVDESLREKGVKTVTIIDKRPSKENPYYLIGHYQLLPATDHMFRMSLYRVDISTNTVDYQSWGDFIKDKWKRVN